MYRLLRFLPTLALLLAIVWGGYWVLNDLRTPLASGWNPLLSLDLTDDATSLAGFKMRRALATPEIFLPRSPPVPTLCCCRRSTRGRIAGSRFGSRCAESAG
ncbi:MAG: hypothetical protein WBA25_14135 [Jannaschia sp.]